MKSTHAQFIEESFFPKHRHERRERRPVYQSPPSIVGTVRGFLRFPNWTRLSFLGGDTHTIRGLDEHTQNVNSLSVTLYSRVYLRLVGGHFERRRPTLLWNFGVYILGQRSGTMITDIEGGNMVCAKQRSR